MDPQTLANRCQDITILDVRDADEFAQGSIAGARHIPLDQLKDRREELDVARPVVVICKTGKRSAMAAERLAEHGYTTEVLDGGLEGWVTDGLAVATPDGQPGTVAGVEVAPPGEANPEHDRIKSAFMELALAAQARFGDREPTEAELRALALELLTARGISQAEAEDILDAEE